MSDSKQMRPASRTRDAIFQWFCLAMACVVLLLIVLVGDVLWSGSADVFRKFGWKFLTTSEWDPVSGSFGALPFVFGTLVSSLLALLIAAPLAIATAIYLTELAPHRLRQPLVFMIEMLSAIPSVIYGLWAIFVMLPWLSQYVFPVLKETLGQLPRGGTVGGHYVAGPGALFSGTIGAGYSMLSGALIIAVMILPIITSVSREILRSVPDLQREAAYGLGATRWEVTRIAVLSYAKKGIFGAMILGLGRALGETMAVTMVIGNTPRIAASLFSPGYTLASVIANEFAEATSDDYLHALVAIGLVLMAVTVVVNLCAQLILKLSGTEAGAVR